MHPLTSVSVILLPGWRTGGTAACPVDSWLPGVRGRGGNGQLGQPGCHFVGQPRVGGAPISSRADGTSGFCPLCTAA